MQFEVREVELVVVVLNDEVELRDGDVRVVVLLKVLEVERRLLRLWRVEPAETEEMVLA